VEEGLDERNCSAGVRRESVGADLLGEGLRDWGPADHHLHTATDSKILQGLDRDSHVVHSRCQKCGHPHHLRGVLPYRRGELLRRDIGPKSTTSYPAPPSIIATRFFPMSCRSPLTVPISTLPAVRSPEATSYGCRIPRPPCIARAATSISGT